MATFMATGLALAGWLELRGNANPWLKGLRYGVILAASLLLVALQSRVGQLGVCWCCSCSCPHCIVRGGWHRYWDWLHSVSGWGSPPSTGSVVSNVGWRLISPAECVPSTGPMPPS